MHDIALPRSRQTLPLRPPQEESRGVRGWLAGQYNKVYRTISPARLTPSHLVELCEIRRLACSPSDIDEHLELMFSETLLLRPKLIVELGVRSGTSTFVFERAARLVEASMVSVDLCDCSALSAYDRWQFIQSDDVALAAEFPEHCNRHGLNPTVDLLFIDTSHYYQHTVEEIASWFPLLSPRAKVIFHDTNLKLIGPRSDGCYQLSWDNQRGVIRAIESYLAISIDETQRFTEYANGWLLRHWPNCNGLTILDRLP